MVIFRPSPVGIAPLTSMCFLVCLEHAIINISILFTLYVDNCCDNYVVSSDDINKLKQENEKLQAENATLKHETENSKAAISTINCEATCNC
jgi:cell division protein FtsB